MSLDPDARIVYDTLNAAARTPYASLTPEEARAAMRRSRGVFGTPPPDVQSVQDLRAGPMGMPLRIYRGHGLRSGETGPLLVFLHGGGWVLGGIDTHDALCRQLANAAACNVASVEYRLAPEHKFPAAIEDARSACDWLRGHASALGFDAQRMAIGGDSAGGNLAAVACLEDRDRGVAPFALQLLIYPALDLGFQHASYARVGSGGYVMSTATMCWFRDQYLTDPAQQQDWRVSPLRASDLSCLPPAFIVTAGYDPLCDEGIEFAGRLARQGVSVTHRHLAGQMHSFLTMGKVIRAADPMVHDIATALAAAWQA